MSRYTTMGTAIALALLTAAVAFASDGHAEGEQSSGMNFVWRLLNIAVFVGILYKLVGAKAKTFFIGRRDGIRTELEDLEARKTEAELHLVEIKKRIANLEAERAAILQGTSFEIQAQENKVMKTA